MIIYNPHDGEAYTSTILSNPRTCFLMTRLGNPIPDEVQEIRKQISKVCNSKDFEVIDANFRVTGRDFLTKIWKLIASTPISIAICHEEFPLNTQGNIFYEIGVAQALGKETILVKSSRLRELPSDFVRSEYVEFNGEFNNKFEAYLDSVLEQAEHYEFVADQLDRNPILAIDYLKRAYLISGEQRLRIKAQQLLNIAGIENRAKNSIEVLTASF